MKKLYSLILLLIFAWSSSAQNTYSIGPVGYPQLLPIHKEKIKQSQAKAYGDTLYYEDFDSSGTGGLPPGWTIGGPNNHDWIWSNTAPGGAYSTSIGPMNSTTASNGYLLLPLDLYNTPWPSTGPIAANNWITTPAISINPKASVLLRFEQFYRYCCTIAGDWVVEVSADSINWTSFDNKMGRGASFMPNNPEPLEYDVSSVLGNQSTVYIRFRVTGLSHYFFMVDDLHLVEGYANSLVLNDATVNFGDTFNLRPSYTIVPYDCDMNLSVDLTAYNNGSNTQTGMMGITQIIHDSTLSGGTGQGLMATVFNNGKAVLTSNASDTINVSLPSYHFLNLGYYTLRSRVQSDSTNQSPMLALSEYKLIISDTIFARDRNFFSGGVGTGPSRYVG